MGEMPEVGETVQWHVRALMNGSRPCSGTVVATGVEEWGYDDIIKVDTGDDVVDIRPEDIV